MKILPLRRFTIVGNSMLPTLKPGQDVLVLCWPRLNRGWVFKLKVRDLVVFRKDGKEIVKRVQKCDDRRIFVVGDNQKMSTDSRHFGWVDKKEIIGKVIWY